jgi:hypothetical protein
MAGPQPYQISPYHPSLRERMMGGARSVAELFGAGRYGQQYVSDRVGSILDFIPLVGDAIGADEVRRDIRGHRYGSAAAGTVATLAGLLPIAGDAAGKAIKKLARGRFDLDYFGQPVRILQNPTPQQTAGFINRTKHKAARRIVDPKTGETFVWDAADPALHKLVAERLGLTGEDLIMSMIRID